MSPHSPERLDLKCGNGAVSEGERCTKGSAARRVATKSAAVGVALTAAALLTHKGRHAPGLSISTPVRVLPGAPKPAALLTAGAVRKSKTMRMQENTAAQAAIARGRLRQTAREEVRRIGQIGNTMAELGEAAGMASKLSARNFRLRTEAARRKYEPGYRKADDDDAVAKSRTILREAETPITRMNP